jgi:hypothetical protein
MPAMDWVLVSLTAQLDIRGNSKAGPYLMATGALSVAGKYFLLRRSMEVFDNVSKIVKTDLEGSIEKGSRLSIAAACFSIYAYQALKKQLDGIEELRFIFTSPAFVTEKVPKEKREFYIPA